MIQYGYSQWYIWTNIGYQTWNFDACDRSNL